MRRLKALVPELPDAAALAARIEADGWHKLEHAMPGLKERAKTLVELLDSAAFLFAERPLALDDQAASCSTRPGARDCSRDFCRALEAVEPLDGRGAEAAVRGFRRGNRP